MGCFKMKVKDEATGKEKKLDPWSKDEVDDMLKANGITIEHDKGYDVAYVANMLKADFFKKSLVDEAHLCKHISATLMILMGTLAAFDEFFATCIGPWMGLNQIHYSQTDNIWIP